MVLIKIVDERVRPDESTDVNKFVSVQGQRPTEILLNTDHIISIEPRTLSDHTLCLIVMTDRSRIWVKKELAELVFLGPEGKLR